MLTKEQLTDAHEQGLSISTRNGNIKIVAILGDIYGVNHFNSNKVNWWMFEQFERQNATIEQPKPKIDLSILKEGNIYYLKSDKSSYLIKFLYSQLKDIEIIWDCNYALRNNCIYREINGIKGSFITELRLPTESELELFYSKFPDLKPKKYIQGFEIKDGYNDVVMVSDDKISINTSFPNVEIRILKEVREHEYPFKMQDGSLFEYARYPRKNEFNEIKFSN